MAVMTVLLSLANFDPEADRSLRYANSFAKYSNALIWKQYRRQGYNQQDICTFLAIDTQIPLENLSSGEEPADIMPGPQETDSIKSVGDYKPTTVFTINSCH